MIIARVQSIDPDDRSFDTLVGMRVSPQVGMRIKLPDGRTPLVVRMWFNTVDIDNPEENAPDIGLQVREVNV